MDGQDRPPTHRRRQTGAGDLLICFGPRRRHPHRLRSSSSVKSSGAPHSPAIFPSIRGGSTRRKAPLDSPSAEPSSPKVSCIGQVRVKTAAAAARRRRKKNNSHPDTRSKDPTFTPSASTRQQSWVHLPLGNFCHGLNCFRPCEKEKKAPSLSPPSPRCCSCSCSCGSCCQSSTRRRKRARMCACRAAFARCWLMEVEEKEEEEEDEREAVVAVRERSRRGMRELELLADELEKGELKIPPVAEEEGEGASDAVAAESVACVPPKNALLLMRCRSDPTRMKSLTATRFDDSNIAGSVVEEEEGSEIIRVSTVEGNGKNPEKIGFGKVENEERNRSSLPPLPPSQARKSVGEEEKENRDSMEEARKSDKEERRRSFKREGGGGVSARRSTSYKEGRRSSFSTEGEARRSSFEKEGRRRWSFSSEKDARRGEGKGVAALQKEVKIGDGEKKGELPDCLLMMMYEPKLSMEVSKETWVCSEDFVRKQQQQQQRRHQKVPCQDKSVDGIEEHVTEESNAVEVENDVDPTPPEVAIDPTPPEVAIDPTPPEAAIDPTPPEADIDTPSLRSPHVASSLQSGSRKPISAGNNVLESAAYGPFALIRCKSEPARSSASGDISLDGCFWRSRHQPAGAAGLGF